ncbi:hypothetical protein [Neobacillus terrae]|uniref:hypothetical protein n=1 Tax=Neobacillus terrae TaxID=3034837 RepID=UPI00140CD97C|nr:hypothetical protein [Neobacillus terrae]NHM30979.1 hypothetical protein [Neobacillus terrae]
MSFRNNSEYEERGIFKSATKSFLNSVKFGSIFDRDLTDEKIQKTKELRAKDFFNHMTGKKSMSKEDIDNLKTVAKYMGKV